MICFGNVYIGKIQLFGRFDHALDKARVINYLPFSDFARLPSFNNSCNPISTVSLSPPRPFPNQHDVGAETSAIFADDLHVIVNLNTNLFILGDNLTIFADANPVA
jgi:hypothetical protein